MVFGITGGLTFAYIPLIKVTNMPIVAYRMFPDRSSREQPKTRCRFQDKRYRDKGEALDELTRLIDGGEIVGLQTSVYWLPYFPPEMRFQFNAHNLIVYGREGKNSCQRPILNMPSGSRLRTSKTPLPPRDPCPEGFMYYPSGSIPR